MKRLACLFFIFFALFSVSVLAKLPDDRHSKDTQICLPCTFESKNRKVVGCMLLSSDCEGVDDDIRENVSDLGKQLADNIGFTDISWCNLGNWNDISESFLEQLYNSLSCNNVSGVISLQVEWEIKKGIGDVFIRQFNELKKYCPVVYNRIIKIVFSSLCPNFKEEDVDDTYLEGAESDLDLWCRRWAILTVLAIRPDVYKKTDSDIESASICGTALSATERQFMSFDLDLLKKSIAESISIENQKNTVGAGRLLRSMSDEFEEGRRKGCQKNRQAIRTEQEIGAALREIGDTLDKEYRQRENTTQTLPVPEKRLGDPSLSEPLVSTPVVLVNTQQSMPSAEVKREENQYATGGVEKSDAIGQVGVNDTDPTCQELSDAKAKVIDNIIKFFWLQANAHKNSPERLPLLAGSLEAVHDLFNRSTKKAKFAN